MPNLSFPFFFIPFLSFFGSFNKLLRLEWAWIMIFSGNKRIFLCIIETHKYSCDVSQSHKQFVTSHRNLLKETFNFIASIHAKEITLKNLWKFNWVYLEGILLICLMALRGIKFCRKTFFLLIQLEFPESLRWVPLL